MDGGVCVGVFVALDMLASRKQRRKALARKRRLARARRRRVFVQRQARERLFFALVLSTLVFNCCSPTRSLWRKERSSYWWDHVVNSTFSTHDWLENFRMSQATFLYVCNEIRPVIEKEDTVMRVAIPVEQRVALTLWFLATNSDYRTIGHLFGVSKPTVSVVSKEVCAAIVKILLPKYIRIPTGDSLKAVIEGFQEKLGFPQCVGVVDGTHIPIVSPVECPADYYNRKGWHSIIMQGTVDHLGHFIDIYVGWPGRVHDARVFVNSSLYKKGQDGALFPDWKRTISGKEIPLLMLGDPAYPLLPWLMKAFPDNGSLSCEQKTFNYRLSRARVVVEHAYGRLKGRWRCLLKRNDVQVDDLPKLVAACCVLHNVCETRGDSFDEDWMQDITDHHSVSGSSNSSVCNSGKDTREALMTYFSE